MTYRYVAFLGMLAVLGACKGREHHDPLALPSASEPEKPKKPLADLFSARAPSFPAIFHGVKPGMSADEAAKQIPGMDKDYGIELADYGTSANLFVNSDTKKVGTLNFFAGKEGLSLASAAWGKPIVVKDIGGRDVSYWFNPKEHVRAKADEMMGIVTVHLDSYVPFAEFLGGDKAAFAFEKGKSLVGQSVEEIKQNYAANVLEKTAAENKAMNDKVQAFVGKKLDMGAAEASLSLTYPPSEWEGIPKTVSLHFEKGKVTYYMFDISYDDYPPVKDEILALLKKTYGEPKTVKDFSDTYLVFRKSPTVKVKDETITKAWSFTVEK